MEGEELAEAIRSYQKIKLLSPKELKRMQDDIQAKEGRDFTRGHYFRGVL